MSPCPGDSLSRGAEIVCNTAGRGGRCLRNIKTSASSLEFFNQHGYFSEKQCAFLSDNSGALHFQVLFYKIKHIWFNDNFFKLAKIRKASYNLYRSVFSEQELEEFWNKKKTTFLS